MWHNNKKVLLTHTKNGPRMAWAIIEGISGWQRIHPTSIDGVANIFLIVSTAQANSRKVDVYIKSGHILEATLR